MTVMEWQSGIVISGRNGNGNDFMGMGGNGNRNSASRTPLE